MSLQAYFLVAVLEIFDCEVIVYPLYNIQVVCFSLANTMMTTTLFIKVLYGVPFTCKEAFGFKEFVQTGGLVRRRDIIASENAVVVQKMLDAGAILLASTNVSELCMWWESNNCVYGRSRNPYSTEHIVGGSSGGEAAIVAAAGSVIGIGSGKL